MAGGVRSAVSRYWLKYAPSSSATSGGIGPRHAIANTVPPEVTYSRTTVPSGALSIATLYGLAVRAPVGGAGAADCVTLAFIRAASRATEAEDSPNVARAGRTPAANGRIAAASRSTSPP